MNVTPPQGFERRALFATDEATAEIMGRQPCYHHPVENRTEPKTPGQWLRYVIVAIIALGLVVWMLRLYVL